MKHLTDSDLTTWKTDTLQFRSGRVCERIGQLLVRQGEELNQVELQSQIDRLNTDLQLIDAELTKRGASKIY